jgi:hypothetical protein
MSELTPLILKSLGSVSSSNYVASLSSAISPNGDIYVCGLFLGTLDIGGGIPPISTSTEKDGGFIAKYTNSLRPLALIGLVSGTSNRNIACSSVAISNTGDVYVTGFFDGTLDIGGDVPSIGTSSTESSIFLARYSNILDPLALKELKTELSDESRGLGNGIYLAISQNGDVYVTGIFNGTLNIGGGVPPISESTEVAGFIAKYTISLSPLALVGLVGKNPADSSPCFSLAIDNNGDLYVCGLFTGTLNIGGGIPPINSKKDSGFVAKYNNNLRPLALIELSSSNVASCTYIAIAKNGDVFVCGFFTGTLNIGGGVPPITTSGTSILGGGFIAKYTNSLSPLALKGLVSKNPADTSVCFSLTVDNNGDLYVCGFFTGTLNVGGGIPPITNTGFYTNGFLLVLNSNLTSKSLNSVLNANFVIGFNNILIDYYTGELILTGSFTGKTDIGGGVPPITLIKDTLQGSFLAKYLNNIEPICLVADTPIRTDQGIVLIQNIDKAIHTIGGKRIVAITKAITPEKHLICFEQHCMGINLPNKRTVMTPGHEVLYKGKLVQAKHFVGKIDGVHTVPYDGKVVYNVLLEKHGLMSVNNMTLETLHPENKVAKMILKLL